MQTMNAALALTTALLLLPCATGVDCFQDPSVCGVKPYEICTPCDHNPSTGCCTAPSRSPDCYTFPGVCDNATHWCELNDRKSWNETDVTTMGRCVPYQKICESCTADLSENSPPSVLPGLDAYDFVAPGYIHEGKPLGSFVKRATRCGPSLICTGEVVPSLPATCVQHRKPPQGQDLPTRGNLQSWGRRMLRMGARNMQNTVKNIPPSEQRDQGVTRDTIHQGVNLILSALWRLDLWGTFEVLRVDETHDELCCNWDNYTAKLSEYQLNRTIEFRNVLFPNDPVRGNPPPCVWCQFDGAYNDENPSVWSLLHALTFNLPETVSEQQYQVLRSIPLWLREHLSCSLCRSHIKEHLIELGVPESHMGVDWAHYFWRTHNVVNEQSEVTRCGSQSCGWGIWSTPSANLCAGVYRNPWFFDFASATLQWRVGGNASAAAVR